MTLAVSTRIVMTVLALVSAACGEGGQGSIASPAQNPTNNALTQNSSITGAQAPATIGAIENVE